MPLSPSESPQVVRWPLAELPHRLKQLRIQELPLAARQLVARQIACKCTLVHPISAHTEKLRDLSRVHERLTIASTHTTTCSCSVDATSRFDARFASTCFTSCRASSLGVSNSCQSSRNSFCSR